MQSEINPVTRKWLSIRWSAGRFSLWWTGSRQSSNLFNRWDCCLERRDLVLSAFVVNVWGFVPRRPTPLRVGLAKTRRSEIVFKCPFLHSPKLSALDFKSCFLCLMAVFSFRPDVFKMLLAWGREGYQEGWHAGRTPQAGHTWLISVLYITLRSQLDFVWGGKTKVNSVACKRERKQQEC